MPNRNAEKGARFERAVRDFLAEILSRFSVVRPHQEGYRDVGDLHVDPFVLQLKDVTALDVSGWLRDVETQRGHAGGLWGAVVWKRRSRPVGDAVVFMTLDTFREVVSELRGRGKPPVDTEINTVQGPGGPTYLFN